MQRTTRAYLISVRDIAGKRVLHAALDAVVPNIGRIYAGRILQKVIMGDDISAISSAIAHAKIHGVVKERIRHAKGRLSALKHESKIRKLISESDAMTTIPDPVDFCCPITCCRMIDPVIASDGMTYERDAIVQYLGRAGTVKLSPLTREPLTRCLESNEKLIADINAYYKAAFDALINVPCRDNA